MGTDAQPTSAPMFYEDGVAFRWQAVVAVLRSDNPVGSLIFLNGACDWVFIRLEFSKAVEMWEAQMNHG